MNFISLGEKKQTGLKQPLRNNKKNKKLPKGKLAYLKRSKNRFFLRSGGIIYIGHIPHGFYEDEMESYFNQFGKVIATCVCRSKKTGRSRGYGYVQFQHEEVAQIAAETMNNYLMYNKILKCRYIPPEERTLNVFESNISPHDYPRKKNRKVECKNKKKALLKLNQDTYLKKVQKKIDQYKTFFEENGVDFTFKVNNEGSNENSTNNTNKKCNAKTSSNQDVESENETDDVNGILEIDESDDEISFKTPPNVKKVIKKSLNSPAVSQCNSLLIKKMSKSNDIPKKIQNEGRSKKNTKLALLKQTQKNKKTEKSSDLTKSQELLKKNCNSIKAKKRTSKKISDATVKKMKKEKVKRNIDVLKSKLQKGKGKK